MPVKLFDAASDSPLGTLSDEQFQFLVDELEEEAPDDTDYYLDAAMIDILEEKGAPPGVVDLLRRALGDREGMDVRWQKS